MHPRFLILIALLMGATPGLAQPAAFALLCASNKTVECFSAWDFDTPVWTNACPPTGGATLAVVGTVTNGPCPLVVTRTWLATDDCGKTALCSQSVTNTDTRAPFIACAPDATIECGTPWTFPLPTAFDHCTAVPDLVFSVVSTITNPTCPPAFTATRIWQVADLCGNTATCTQSVAIVDTTAPSLSCQCLQDPGLVQLTVTACSNAIPDLCALTAACATDICGPLTCTQSPPAGTVVSPGTHPITLIVTDCASNSALCVVDFTVVEPPTGCPCPDGVRVWNTGMGGLSGNVPLAAGTTDPNFTLVGFPPGGCPGPAQVIAAAGVPPPWLPNSPESQWIGPALAVDGCPIGVYRYQLRFDLPCPTNASIVGRLAADDRSALLLNGNPTGVPSATYNTWTPVNISSGFLLGPNVLDFYVTNVGGYTGVRAELTNTYRLTSDPACCCPQPQIACPLPISLPCGTPFTFTPPPALDLCCGTNATVTVLSTATNGTCPQFIHRVWLATDCRGQSVTCTQTVAIVDATPPTFCASDNLVPNPGFEVNTACPSNFNGQIALAPPWFGANGGSSDYYHTCALHPNLGVPNNLAGSQAPHGGQAYAGIHAADTETSPLTPYREYIEVPLVAPLVAGRTYFVSFHVSLSDTAERAVDNLGAHLSAVPLFIATSNVIPVVPQVRNPAGGFLTDKTGWTLIQGEFVAVGGEQFVTIGNFYDNAATPTVALSGTRDWAYYYIDDVQVSEVCCASRTVECGQPLIAGPPAATDACDGTNVTVTLLTGSVSGTACPQIHTLVWQAADVCGNTATCTQLVTVVDTTPPVITCPAAMTKVVCTNSVKVHYKASATDCSPGVTVSCVPPSGSFFNAGTTLVTCTATDPCGNTASCMFTVKVVNDYFWQTLPAGIADCYALNTEPAWRGPCLNAAYPAPLWKNFDSGTLDRRVGYTWVFPPTWTLQAAQLFTRFRPPPGNCVGAENDTISLGLANCSPPSWLWSRYFGSGNPGAGLVNTQWCNGTGCLYPFNFNLAALPSASGPAVNLLPHMNTANRLDLFVQDDTTVDFARLRVYRCAPQILGGIGVELANAWIVQAPAAWCLAVDNPELPAWADLRLGDAAGLRLPLEPLALASHPNSSIEFGGGDLAGGGFPRLAFGADANGTGTVHLHGLPPGIPVIELAVLVEGAVVQSHSLPATDGMPVATFDRAHPLVELALANGDELLATLLEPGPGRQPLRVALRVRLPGYTGGFAETRLLTTAIPEVGVLQPALQLPAPAVDPDGQRQHQPHFYWPGGCSGLAEVSGGQGVVSPLETDSAVPLGFTAGFPRTNQFRLAIETAFGQFAPTPSNASLTLTLLREPVGPTPGPQDDFVALSFAYTGSDWALTARAGNAPLSLARVEVYSHGTNLASVLNPASVQAAQVPDHFWASAPWGLGLEFCYRFPYASPVIVRVNGTAYVADDFIVMTAFPGQDLRTSGGVRVETFGAETLALVQLETGPLRYRVEPPELEGADVVVRGNSLGAVFQSATDPSGPWATVFAEPGEMRAKITNAPQMYYRIKGR